MREEPPEKKGENFVQVIVRMPPEMHAAVKAHSAEHERTMSATIRRAVRLYVEGKP